MECRKLGRTGVEVSMLGLGTEYLNNVPRETTVSVIREAIDRGISYIDIFFAHAAIRDDIGIALEGRRDKAVIAAHLGSAADDDGQYYKTRDRELSEHFFLDFLTRLKMDYVDVLMLHNVDPEDEYEEAMESLLEPAQRFQKEGKARFIGLSTHRPKVALRAIAEGIIDILMYPVNFTGDAMPGRKELLNTCVSNGIGLVAMKPYAGGKLLQKVKSISMEHYQSGWKNMEKDIPTAITPVQCLSYALSQIGVSTTVPGVKDLHELGTALDFLSATDEEKDFSAIIEGFKEYHEGECVYCNHCLPCPVDIDIGRTTRLMEAAQYAISDAIRAEYDALSVKAGECLQCGDCMERCPFEVDVIANMEQAVELFGG
ncbi:aldo/keto reductase [Candidatus Poribacteria bacterium]